jgi:hypothetical protein
VSNPITLNLTSETGAFIHTGQRVSVSSHGRRHSTQRQNRRNLCFFKSASTQAVAVSDLRSKRRFTRHLERELSSPGSPTRLTTHDSLEKDTLKRCSIEQRPGVDATVLSMRGLGKLHHGHVASGGIGELPVFKEALEITQPNPYSTANAAWGRRYLGGGSRPQPVERRKTPFGFHQHSVNIAISHVI